MQSVILLILLASQKFLLMSPIEEAFYLQNYQALEKHSAQFVILEFEVPCRVTGNYQRQQAWQKIAQIFRKYKVKELLWSAMHVEQEVAVQSLNITFEDKTTRLLINMKFIFFMKRQKEWKLFLVKGLGN